MLTARSVKALNSILGKQDGIRFQSAEGTIFNKNYNLGRPFRALLIQIFRYPKFNLGQVKEAPSALGLTIQMEPKCQRLVL